MRTVFQTTASVLALLVLGACASAKPVVPAASNPTLPMPKDGAAIAAVDVGPGAGFTGLWYVSGVFPAAATHASVGDPHLGAVLVIDATEVSDVNGQRCATPIFQADKADARSIGLKAAPVGNWDRLVVTCAGKSFATYILMPAQDGMDASAAMLLQQRPEGLYLLERADQILHRLPSESASNAGPVQAAHDVPTPESVPPAKAAPTDLSTPKAEFAPAPIPEGPVPESAAPVQAASAPPPAAEKSVPKVSAAGVSATGVSATGDAKLPAPGTAMHLASYKGESAAKRGWKTLLGDNDELDPLSPLYVAVDVPGKGAIIRLYATGADEAGLAKICTVLKAKKVYCTLHP